MTCASSLAFSVRTLWETTLLKAAPSLPSFNTRTCARACAIAGRMPGRNEPAGARLSRFPCGDFQRIGSGAAGRRGGRKGTPFGPRREGLLSKTRLSRASACPCSCASCARRSIAWDAPPRTPHFERSRARRGPLGSALRALGRYARAYSEIGSFQYPYKPSRRLQSLDSPMRHVCCRVCCRLTPHADTLTHK